MAAKKTVWCVYYSHKHGDDNSYWTTREAALLTAANIAMEWLHSWIETDNPDNYTGPMALCAHCDQEHKAHVKDKCLTEPTTYLSTARQIVLAYEEGDYSRVIDLYVQGTGHEESLAVTEERIYDGKARYPKDQIEEFKRTCAK